MSKTVTSEKFPERMDQIIDEIFKGLCNGFAESMVDLAPVNTGALRASIEVDPDGSFDPSKVDPSGIETKLRNRQKIESKKYGDEVIIGSAAPYADVIEFGGSDKAPSGFLRVTIQNIPAIERDIQDRINKL